MKALHLLPQPRGSRSRLLDQGRILLGPPVHPGDRGIDRFDAGTLVGARRRDITHDVIDSLNSLHDFLHGLPRSIDRLRSGADFLDRFADETLDLLRGGRRALRQIANFARHHREAAAKPFAAWMQNRRLPEWSLP